MAGLGYSLIIFSSGSLVGTDREICPNEWIAVNRIMDSIGKNRFNETNLLSLFSQ